MTLEALQDLHSEFLNRWDLEALEKMTLEQYVGVNNNDTFCRWVETKTKPLGSIRGMPSIKFGIYERKKEKVPKNYRSDEKYSWIKAYDEGHDRNLAFQCAKRDILLIIQAAIVGRFELIDDIPLPNLFKWKVAFLYSDDRLVPIFQHEVLIKIAHHFGMQANKRTKISEIQNLMIENKPAGLSVHEFMVQLFFKFANEKDKKEIEVAGRRSRTKRKATDGRNTTPHVRKPSTTSFVAEQRHNKIQEALVAQLRAEYGEDCEIPLEENFVDVKVYQPDFIAFYEVKSATDATRCIKEALGQILLYTFNDEDTRVKKLYVVGQYPATEPDKEYIKFVQENLNFDIDYIAVAIS